jgi:sugar phosphate permease
MRGLKSPANVVLLLSWLFFGMYYATRFNYSPMIPLIRAELEISNAQAGWLMAFFFVTYTMFQLPAGFLADRYGPRKVIVGGALISIAGNLVFSQGNTFAALACGQLINGIGQAMGWNSALKLIVSWFSRARRATAIGLFATCVTVGSSAGIRLAGYLGDHLGWRSAFIVPPAMMAVVGVIFWLVVRDSPGARGLPEFDDEVALENMIAGDPRSRLAVVLGHPTLWMVGLVYFFFVYVQFGCLVWIPSILKETYDLTVDRASTIASLVLLPGVLAAPVGGYVSDRYFRGRRKPLLLLGLTILSGSCFLLASGVGQAAATALLAVVGLMIIMPDILLAAYPSDLLSRKLAATGMGFLTTFTSTAGIVTTPATGKIVDYFHSYQAPFVSFGIAALLATVLTLLINERHAGGSGK